MLCVLERGLPMASDVRCWRFQALRAETVQPASVAALLELLRNERRILSGGFQSSNNF